MASVLVEIEQERAGSISPSSGDNDRRVIPRRTREIELSGVMGLLHEGFAP
jgi:hypothetical protein